jgi:hypothetical protein
MSGADRSATRAPKKSWRGTWVERDAMLWSPLLGSLGLVAGFTTRGAGTGALARKMTWVEWMARPGHAPLRAAREQPRCLHNRPAPNRKGFTVAERMSGRMIRPAHDGQSLAVCARFTPKFKR